ncbi:hypothetical protein AAFF_G00058530 [Aldrovandia affinis]|uniref:Uncharacterized protein n=1 Tax=Aldrovandia affinis TaxID=143900 RepID=A0AAD7S0D9_9TELE|nr:hypothetical protein AAFF_G00058530 [Aldrovandia affinis]
MGTSSFWLRREREKTREITRLPPSLHGGEMRPPRLDPRPGVKFQFPSRGLSVPPILSPPPRRRRRWTGAGNGAGARRAPGRLLGGQEALKCTLREALCPRHAHTHRKVNDVRRTPAPTGTPMQKHNNKINLVRPELVGLLPS